MWRIRIETFDKGGSPSFEISWDVGGWDEGDRRWQEARHQLENQQVSTSHLRHRENNFKKGIKKVSIGCTMFSDWIRSSACTWNKRITKKEAKLFLHVGSTLERRVASKFKIINRCALFEIELGAVQLKFDQRKSMATTINSLQRDRCTRMLTTSSSSSSTPSPCSTLTACSEIFASTAGRAEDNNW